MLYGVGEPVWLHSAAFTSRRYDEQLRAEELLSPSRARRRRGLAWSSQRQLLRALLNETCGS
ncbi:MAG: hypothetical protein IPQ07_44195 [Myxococcales bacterium]|nr:hypothetical protein [Myxococcales bacterium]